MRRETLLVKFGEFRFIQKMLAEGELYFRPLAYFAKTDRQFGIGDALETALDYYCPPSPRITLRLNDGRDFEWNEGARIEYHRTDEAKEGHIFCMSMVDWMIEPPKLRIAEPGKMPRIGQNYDAMVVVIDARAFVRRVKRELSAAGYRVLYRPVEYYPEKNHCRETVGPFDKRERYSGQREFRFLFYGGGEDPMAVRIGFLHDIAVLVRLPFKPFF